MSNMRLLAATVALAFAVPADAGDFTGLTPFSSNLFDIDSAAGTVSSAGVITGGSPFGFHSVSRAPDGTLYGIAPGLITGYSVYRIDGNNAATLVGTVATSISGNVGCAVDPSGNSIWVAGFVSLSFNVGVEEVNLTTGVMTPRGNTGGNMGGLAFDGNGDLFTVINNASFNGPLIKIDQVDAGNSTLAAVITTVDLSTGFGLASDVNSGSVHMYSNSGTGLHSVDTTNGNTTLVNNIAGGGSMAITENVPGCTLISEYGAGCAGQGGFTPTLSFNGCPGPSETVSLDVAGAVGGAQCAILFGTGQGAAPIGAGCSLLLTGVAPFSIILPLGGAGFGNGSISLATVLPASLPSGTIYTQAFCQDISLATGFSATNGVCITFP